MSEEKKEWSATMQIPMDATNIEVGKHLESVFNELFNAGATAIACKIFPNEKEIYIKPFSKFVPKKKDIEFTSIRMELNKDLRDKYLQHYSFMFAETIVDIWNKYMPSEFYFKMDEDNKFKIEIGYDMGHTKSQVKAYWFSNNSDGWNTEAQFWRREWLKEEHKRPTTSGGKR